LAYAEIVEIGKKLEWVEALDASKACTTLIEALRGAEPGESIPVGLGCPLLR